MYNIFRNYQILSPNANHFFSKETYSLKHVFQGLQSLPSKTLSIDEIHNEVKTLKEDIHMLKIKEVSISDLRSEIYNLKTEIKFLKDFMQQDIPLIENIEKISTSEETFLNTIDRITYQKCHSHVTIVINKEYTFSGQALIDSGADLNCICEGLVPTHYYDKTSQSLNTATTN